jgi:oligopeptide/dipeptide ABC transporter ATP-binding protein
VKLDGTELVGMSEGDLKGVRGGRIGMIFQDPLSSLNPVLTIGRQITESLETHKGIEGAAAKRRAVELLELVGIPNAGRRVSEYPHQFSGGMRQRAMIAMALACEPSLLIADEPTTALDVTIQAQILDLIGRLRTELGMAVLLITHDLGVVAGFADRVAVMYAGRIVETGLTEEVLEQPRHPYTVGLLRSMPRLDRVRQARLTPIEGSPPDLSGDLVGCAFAPRCAWRIEICRSVDPALEPVAEAAATAGATPLTALHRSACHDQPTQPEVVAGRPLHDTEGIDDPTVTGEALEAPVAFVPTIEGDAAPTILEEGLAEQHVGPLPSTEREHVQDAFRGPPTDMPR